jgi:Domain of unknown function (DUF6438)
MAAILLRFIALIVLCSLPRPATAYDPLPADTVIMLDRGWCEGEGLGCPVYRVLIFADGDVIWQGHSGVAKRGFALGHIEKDQIRALIQAFESIDYFHLENVYNFKGTGCQSNAAFNPTVITLIATRGVSKTLTHHKGCEGDISKKLSDLEDSIDKAANTERWVTGKRQAK